MKRSNYFTLVLAGAMFAGGATLVLADARERYMQWEVHDNDRPQPPVVDPGHAGTQDQAGQAPSDAIVLFDGTSTDAFVKGNGDAPGWTIDDQGNLVVKPRSGGIRTKESFGDVQMRVEWMVPESEANRSGQGRGNSGIFLMGRYEVQVLDNKDNKTYPDGMAGSIYGQFPPMVNAGRGLGKWQSYDIIFRRPHFNDDGSLKKPATLTVLHNGVLVQDHQELMGPTRHKARTSYSKHADALPISLQDHGDPIHFRNIWVRELEPRD